MAVQILGQTVTVEEQALFKVVQRFHQRVMSQKCKKKNKINKIR